MQPPEADHGPLARVCEHYSELSGPGVVIEPLGRGLINQTFRAGTAQRQLVLQRVSAIFDPAIHHNIRAVTRRLRALGLVTPELLDSRAAAPFVDLGPDGVWRLLTWVEGAGFDVVQSHEQAHAAGALVASFHRALEGLDHQFVGLRTGVHDTPAHLASLRQALGSERSHRLHAAVLELGSSILEAAERLPPLPRLAPRPCHGDLKLNNLLFAGSAPPERDRALCLIDLDTLGPMELGVELGDAWRSWCNPAGENQAEARFDSSIFEASWQGYAEAIGRQLAIDERRALLHGVEWVSLELSARFAADALHERYFGWDPGRFAGRAEHNLVRARSQWAVHQATVESRARRAELLGVTPA